MLENGFDINRKFGVEIEVEMPRDLCPETVSSSCSCCAPDRDDFARVLVNRCRQDGIHFAFDELSGYTHQTDSEYEFWLAENDSSLDRGIEVKSPPLKGYEGLRQVEIVVRHLRDMGAIVRNTCGFHCHQDCSDLSVADVVNMGRIWAMGWSKVIQYFIAPSRRNRNRFCYSPEIVGIASNGGRDAVEDHIREATTEAVQNKEVWESKNCLDKCLYGERVFLSGRGQVNIGSLTMRGTIEFRGHQGTLSFRKILAWIIFTQALVNRAKMGDIPLGDNFGYDKEYSIFNFFACLGGPKDVVSDFMKDYLVARWWHFRGLAGLTTDKESAHYPILTPEQVCLPDLMEIISEEQCQEKTK